MEELISYETAKLAKEKGFTENTCDYFSKEVENNRTFSDAYNLPNYHNSYDDRFSAPTQSLLQKWLREVHNIDVRVANKYRYYHLVKDQQYFDRTTYDTYEQALEAGLLEALKLIKTNE